MKLCKDCGKNPVSVVHAYGLYCTSCRGKRYNYSKGKTCPDCGVPIHNKSTRCENCTIAKRKFARPERVCEVCGKQFTSRLPWEKERFCSQACHRQVLGKEAGAIKKSRARPNPPRECVSCGKEYIADITNPNSRFCSLKCYGAWLAKNQTGENHPSWMNDKQHDYGSDFTRQLRREIRERDNYTCQVCGISQSELSEALHIHHIDYDKNNNAPDNLISLCRRCHAKTNGKPNNRKRWFSFFRK